MLYQVSLTVPANTPQSAPESARLILTGGTSVCRAVQFPDGCCGEVGVSVWHYGVQIIPWTQNTWLVSSGNTIADESPYPLTTPPFFFTLYGYNTDTVHDHTITLYVQMQEGMAEEFVNLEQFLQALRGM